MSEPIAQINAALEGRYSIERQIGEGGMATVFLADDLRHDRKVALKVLKPELAAIVGADRFLPEIMPAWAHSGREIFFIDSNELMVSAQVRTDPEFRVGGWQVLFDADEYLSNASNILVSVSPDDERFLMARAGGAEDTGPSFVLVNNFFEVLRQRAPD